MATSPILLHVDGHRRLLKMKKRWVLFAVLGRPQRGNVRSWRDPQVMLSVMVASWQQIWRLVDTAMDGVVEHRGDCA